MSSKQMSILIVDDNSVMRRAIRLMIAELAAEIVECEDGGEAFAAYQRHQPDWVLMDVKMPKTDGLTETREICAVYADAKIVIVTKHGEAQMREAAREAGAWAFVAKDNL